MQTALKAVHDTFGSQLQIFDPHQGGRVGSQSMFHGRYFRARECLSYHGNPRLSAGIPGLP
jgi:hypothetical protein